MKREREGKGKGGEGVGGEGVGGEEEGGEGEGGEGKGGELGLREERGREERRREKEEGKERGREVLLRSSKHVRLRQYAITDHVLFMHVTCLVDYVNMLLRMCSLARGSHLYVAC